MLILPLYYTAPTAYEMKRFSASNSSYAFGERIEYLDLLFAPGAGGKDELPFIFHYQTIVVFVT